MALEIEQDQDQAQPKRRIPTPDEVFGTKKRIPTPDEVFGVKKKATPPSGYSVTPLPSQDKFDIGEEVSTIGYKSPIGKAIQKDKAKGSDLAYIYNSLVGGIASLAGGELANANILAPTTPLPLNVRVANAEADRKKATDFIEQARIERGFPLITPGGGVDWISSSREYEQQEGAFDVNPTKSKDGISREESIGVQMIDPKKLNPAQLIRYNDLMSKDKPGSLLSGVDSKDVKSLALNTPQTLFNMVLGGKTGGYSFFSQAVNDNLKDLKETGAGDKLTDAQKIGYVYTQAVAQSALEKVSIDKVFKNTGLSKTIQNKVTAEVIDNFVKTGKKATAKDIEREVLKKVSTLSNKIKNVGIKAVEDAATEGSTEGIQQGGSDIIKLTTNKIAEKEVFNEEDINENFWKNIVNNTVMGGVTGFVMGSGLQGLNSTDKAIRQEVANATGEKKFYVDDKEVTEKEFSQSTGNKKVTTDLQNIQDQINKQVEEGNLTPEEAEAASITAQQYAEIAGKIPTTVSKEDKYKIIGGISQRNSLQQDLQKAREEMMEVDPIFRKEKQDQIDLIEAKIDETEDYLEGLATGKKPRYVKRDGKKGEETTYYKVDENGDKTQISKIRYELAKAIKKEDSRKKAPVDENRRRRVEQFDILYGVKSNNPEFDFPDTFEEFNKKIDSDPNYLPDLYKRAQQYKETGEIAEDEMGTEASFIEAINPPVEKDITIGEVVDKKGTYKGQKGTFLQEGDSIVFENETSGEKYEIGKASEIQEKPASEFDVKYDESLVSVDDEGNINVREKPYINRYSNPLKAINKDENGNIVSVNLETADGKKRTFKGSIAEDIAYQINLKEKSKNEPKSKVETTVVKEPMQPTENVEPVVEVKEEVEPVEVVEIPLDLEEKGEPIGSTLEAERRRSNGERIFAVTEQDEEPVEVTSVEMLRSYTPDQLLAYKPTEVTEETSKVEYRKNLADKIRSLKTEKGTLNLLPDLGLTKTLYDGALDFLANQVEQGTTFGKAIQNTIEWVDKKLNNVKWDKELFSRKAISLFTESSVKPGNIQPAMILTAKKGGVEETTYSGENSMQSLKDNKSDMYISRADELSKSHLVQGKVKKLNSDWTKEQKLKWADEVYSRAKATVVSNLLYLYDNIPEKVRTISKLWYDGANKIAKEFADKYNTSHEQAAAVIATQSPQKPWFDNLHLAQFIMDFNHNKKDNIFTKEAFDYYKKTGEKYPAQVAYFSELEKSIGKKYSELSDYDKSALIRYEFDNKYERTAPLRLPTGHIVGRTTASSSFSGYDTIAKAISILNDGSPENISNNLGSASKVRNFNNNIINPTSDKYSTIDTHAMAAGYFLPLGSKSPEVKFDPATYSFFHDAYAEAAKQRGVLPREMQSITWEGVKSLFPPSDKTEANKSATRELWNKYKNGEISIEDIQKTIKENGKDLSKTDWSGLIDNSLKEGKTGGFVEELPLNSRNRDASGQGVAGGVETEVSEMGTGVKPTISEKGKKIANTLRKGKVTLDKNVLQSNIAGIPIALYNTVIETIATAIESGSTLTEAIIYAIKKHKLRNINEFNKSEFIGKIEDITNEKIEIKEAIDKLKEIKSFKNKKNFIKDNLKNEEDKKAIDELDFTEQDLIEIANSEFDLPTFKNIKDAVQKRSTEEILQPEQGEAGKSGGGRKRMEPRVEGETTTGEGDGAKTAQSESTTEIPEEIENVGLDGGDVDYVRITAADIGELRKSLGLPPYKGLPLETHEMLREAAQEMIKKGVSVESLYDKIKLGKILTNYENAFMAEYRAALDLELKNNPSPELLAKITEFADIFQQSASQTGKALESLKIIKKLNEANTLSNFLLSRQEDKGYPLTPKMMIEETAKFEKIQEAKEQLQESVDNDIQEQLKAEVEMESKKEDKTKAKKSHEEFVKERNDALAAAREAVKKVNKGGGGLMASAPGLPQLFAVAPHMNKYVRSLFAEGVSKLEDIVTEVHKEFSGLVEGLTKRDILDVIAGKYNLKKKTANDISAGIRMLRREAELLGLLEKARLGQEEAKSEAQIQEKGKRIQELEAKIKEVKKLYKAKELSEEGVTEAFKENLTDTEYNKKRQKFLDKKIAELESDLENKNYDKETKETPKYTISKKTKQKMDRVIELEKELAIERYKEQYSKLNKWQKAWETVKNITGIRRIVQTALDASIWFRQLAKVTLNPRKWDIAAKFLYAGSQSVFSQKNYDRLMYGIQQSPDFKNMVKEGIRFNDLNAIDSKNVNEFTNPQSIVYKIPIIRNLMVASQRIADASMNVARYELYQKYQKVLLSKGITRESDPKVYEGMAKWVMNSTGSGNMLKLLESKAGQETAGTLFYGARLMAANFNTLNLAYYVKMPSEVREMAWKDMAAYTSTVIMSTLALAAAGGTVSMDPDDPEFLQVRFGKKVYDLTAGQAPYIRTFLRIIEAFGATGSQVLGYTSKFEARKSRDFASNSVLNFFRNKLSPNYSYAVNAYVGKNTIGQDFNPMEVFQIYPMYADDVYNAVKEDGMVSLLTVLMPNILGVGFSSYYSDKTMKPMDETIEMAKNSDELNPETIKKGMTMKEFKEYAEMRDKLIEEKITKLYKEGIYDNREEKYVPITKSTPEEITAAIIKAKRQATTESKSKFNLNNEEEDDEK